ASGRYGSCRLNVDARAASGGSTPAFAKCDARFADKWRRAEAKGDDQCPSSAERVTIQGFLAQCTDGVATAPAGGALPACPGQASTMARRSRRAVDCESSQLQAAAEYTSCRLTANAAAVGDGSATSDFADCDKAFTKSWRARGKCTQSDPAAIQAFL